MGEYSNNFCFDLFIAASTLGLTGMANYLQKYFIENKPFWIKEYLVKVYQTSLKYENFTELRKHCKGLIEKEPALLFQSNSFPSLEKNILFDVIQRDDLSLPEVEIWNNLIVWGIEQTPPINERDVKRWRTSDFNLLKERIRDLVPYIRFYTIPPNDYYKSVRPYKDVLSPKLVEQLEEDYMMRNILPPSNTLQPGILRRNTSISKPRYFVRRSVRNPVQNNKEKQPPAETIPETADEVLTRPLNPRLAIPPPIGSSYSELIDRTQIKRISRWIDEMDGYNHFENPNPKNNFTLLASGSGEDLTQEKFLELCGNKGPTLFLAEVDETKNIIGGIIPNHGKERMNGFIQLKVLYFRLNLFEIEKGLIILFLAE